MDNHILLHKNNLNFQTKLSNSSQNHQMIQQNIPTKLDIFRSVKGKNLWSEEAKLLEKDKVELGEGQFRRGLSIWSCP